MRHDAPMTLDPETCYRAVASRDRRFEGRFVIAVTTTGVYCRPGCPAPLPRRRNSRFFACAAAAEDAGFRPCRRCRPESAPGTPAWLGTSATVSRALRLVLEGSLDDAGVDALASRVGVGSRHLRRLFAEHLGASPLSIARTRRAHFAKKLVEETDLPMTEVAAVSGFASVRSFNQSVQETFHRSPRELRATRGRTHPDAGDGMLLRLPFRAPLDWARLTGFLGARAIPGVESVEHGVYRRTIEVEEGAGTLEASVPRGAHHVELRLRLPVSRRLVQITERANRMFDLGADPGAIAAALTRDPRLAPLLKARPGLRVPGTWDPFELAVRAILGQQVSVRGATTLAGRMARAFGTPLKEPAHGLTHLFPRPDALAHADVASIGMPRSRGEAIRSLAVAVRDGAVTLDASLGLEDAVARLTALPGIGPWTAQYIAMRALREPDAFPAGDLGLLKAWAGSGARPTAAALERASEGWRPWRAYAALHLWTSLDPNAEE
jgi:AraC family transcriptional regulator, regulatory protein of adaptative response / DNA-3-methyladenine glycosylase II